MRELVPAVTQPDEKPAAPVESAFHTGSERFGQASFDVELPVEVRLEQADIAEGRDTPVDGGFIEHQRECRRGIARARRGAIGIAHREGNRGALTDRAQQALDGAFH